jgi:hypothetical protein
LSVVGFCRQNGIATHKFYYWKQRLGGSATPESFVAVKVARPSKEESRRVVEVQLRSGRVMRVLAGFERECLETLIEILEAQA